MAKIKVTEAVPGMDCMPVDNGLYECEVSDSTSGTYTLESAQIGVYIYIILLIVGLFVTGFFGLYKKRKSIKILFFIIIFFMIITGLIYKYRLDIAPMIYS